MIAEQELAQRVGQAVRDDLGTRATRLDGTVEPNSPVCHWYAAQFVSATQSPKEQLSRSPTS